MLPITIDSAKTRILLVGDGPATQHRIAFLEEAGASFTHLQQAEQVTDAALQQCDVVFIADFGEEVSAALYARAKSAGALVNVEDKKPYCDFHVPARVRRGDLLLTVSTAGKSPRVARRVRHMLESLFPASWAEWLHDLSEQRDQWKAEGASFSELSERSDAYMDQQGWLQADCACLKRQNQAGGQ